MNVRKQCLTLSFLLPPSLLPKVLFEFKGAPGGINSNNMCADTEGVVKYACNGTRRPFQLVFVSATMPDAALKKMGEVYWQQPKIKAAVKKERLNHKGLIRIEHEGSGTLLAGIKNFHVQTDNAMAQEFGGVWEAKSAVLHDLYDELGLSRGGCQTIVFCESQVQVTQVYNEMRSRKRGNVTTLLKAFRQGKKGMLITTRVLNRGIDIPHVQLVINFSLANLTAENFVHGVGRCGRHGKVGAGGKRERERDGDKKNTNLPCCALCTSLCLVHVHWRRTFDMILTQLCSTLFHSLHVSFDHSGAVWERKGAL
jgi:hypothetical protein